ncbi:uncharacterized transmembrane protein DDB_G0289901-like isoform X2 [Belonocnema kinseyi]|uniref:uncharacterized transmembrane protein DDB_G0289901-like isoform X2 n=1 Tax=Belonocnema kinseyi TaxID=2817044 RepID=UPI00143D6503|nr:uncharacterized transmembrane protein DDB_G0289901-like isoform X2 [Belonocnema kinseyi]
MKTSCILCGLLLVVGLVASSPIVKRAAEDDLSPLNEVYVMENEDEAGLDDDRGDRDKRKIGIVKLGVTNGLINFVFGKLDAFINAKTKALIVLDESNKAKNAAFGIDNTQSATTQFLTNLIGQKIQAGTASIGPAINSATTFFSSAKTGLAGAFASKFAPLSSLSGGLTSGLAGGLSAGNSGDSNGGGGSGNILSTLTSLSGSSSGGDLSGGSSGNNGNSHSDEVSSDENEGAGASVGVNLGGFANLGGGGY